MVLDRVAQVINVYIGVSELSVYCLSQGTSSLSNKKDVPKTEPSFLPQLRCKFNAVMKAILKGHKVHSMLHDMLPDQKCVIHVFFLYILGLWGASVKAFF